MKLETIFTVGIVAVVLYLIYEILQTIGVTPAGVQSAVTATGNVIENAATGSLSSSQQDELVQQETASLVQAGMSPSQAQAQAQSDVAATQALPQPTYWDGVKAAFLSL